MNRIKNRQQRINKLAEQIINASALFRITPKMKDFMNSIKDKTNFRISPETRNKFQHITKNKRATFQRIDPKDFLRIYKKRAPKYKKPKEQEPTAFIWSPISGVFLIGQSQESHQSLVNKLNEPKIKSEEDVFRGYIEPDSNNIFAYTYHPTFFGPSYIPPELHVMLMQKFKTFIKGLGFTGTFS